MTDSFDSCIDAQGLLCPEPVMLLHNAMRQVEAGAVVKVIATDPSTQRDIPKFCQFLGHMLVESSIEQKEGGDTIFIYRIEKTANKNS